MSEENDLDPCNANFARCEVCDRVDCPTISVRTEAEISSSIGDLLDRADGGEDVSSEYRTLLAESSGRIAAAADCAARAVNWREKARSTIAELRDARERIAELEQTVFTRDHQLKEVDSRVAALDERIADRTRVAADMSKEISRLTDLAAELESRGEIRGGS